MQSRGSARKTQPPRSTPSLRRPGYRHAALAGHDRSFDSEQLAERHDDQCDSISQALLDKNNSFMQWLSRDDWKRVNAKAKASARRAAFRRHGF
jgi:hypothetical protein